MALNRGRVATSNGTGETVRGAPRRDVTQGAFGEAEFYALEGLLPVLERRRKGEAGVRRLRYFEGERLWQTGHEGQWSWPLLAAALSRSHTPQGHPVMDGRTEDLVGLGLLRTTGDTIVSAQLFRPPAPQQEQYSRLAGTLLDFFISGRPPWPVERSLLEAELMAVMTSPAARSSRWITL